MKKLVLGLIAALSFAACDGGDATCAVCNQSFTTPQCNSIALNNGCASGEAQPMACGGNMVQGCVLRGCATGRGVMCNASPSDAGTD